MQRLSYSNWLQAWPFVTFSKKIMGKWNWKTISFCCNFFFEIYTQYSNSTHFCINFLEAPHIICSVLLEPGLWKFCFLFISSLVQSIADSRGRKPRAEEPDISPTYLRCSSGVVWQCYWTPAPQRAQDWVHHTSCRNLCIQAGPPSQSSAPCLHIASPLTARALPYWLDFSNL